MGLFRAPPAEPPPATGRTLALYCGAQGLSSVGDWMQRAGMGWLSWELTHSPGWVGAMALTEVVMPLWITPLAGALVDRQSPFRIFLATQSLMVLNAIALTIYVFSGAAHILGLFAFALIGSGLTALNSPVRFTVINMVSPPGRLSQGIAVNSVMFNLARVVGPAFAGAVMVTGHIYPVFAATAFSGVAMLVVVFHLQRWLDRPPSARGQGLSADIAEGLRYILTTPQVAVLFAMAAAFGFLARPFSDLLPAVAGQVFHAGPEGLSGMMTAQGLGALVGAGLMLRRHGVQRLLLLAFSAGVGLALAVVALSVAPDLGAALIVIGVAGAGHTACNVGLQSLIQLRADESFRGRVMSVYALLFRSASSASAFLIGLAAEVWGLRLMLGLTASLGVVLIGVIALRARRIYRAAVEPA